MLDQRQSFKESDVLAQEAVQYERDSLGDNGAMVDDDEPEQRIVT